MDDLSIYETGSGGDLQLKGNDIASSSGIFSMVYMAFFGGNYEITTGNEIDSELRDDWFGNSLLFDDEPEIQFNSNLQRALNETPLTSSGRLKIEQAAKKDLEFMKSFAEVSVSVSILDDNHVQISVKMKEPENIKEKEFQMIWDSLENEIIIEKTI